MTHRDGEGERRAQAHLARDPDYASCESKSFDGLQTRAETPLKMRLLSPEANSRPVALFRRYVKRENRQPNLAARVTGKVEFKLLPGWVLRRLWSSREARMQWALICDLGQALKWEPGDLFERRGHRR